MVDLNLMGLTYSIAMGCAGERRLRNTGQSIVLIAAATAPTFFAANNCSTCTDDPIVIDNSWSSGDATGHAALLSFTLTDLSDQ